MKKKVNPSWYQEDDYDDDDMSMMSKKGHMMHHHMKHEMHGDMHGDMHQHGMCQMMLAHAYVPWQCYEKAFCPEEALMKGTLFPELWGAYPIPE